MSEQKPLANCPGCGEKVLGTPYVVLQLEGEYMIYHYGCCDLLSITDP